MPIIPRFQRVAALQRPFVNRERIISEFSAELAREPSGPRVFNVTGVGGIGKTRLLRELQRIAHSEEWRTAEIDLQVPVMRRHEEALAALRSQLGSQHVTFDRFDIAYAVQWQRLHPNVQLSKSELPFAQYSSVLSEILDNVQGMHLFGTAATLLILAEKGTIGIRRKVMIRRDQTLKMIDEMPNSELADATTYLFAEDLRNSSRKQRSLIVIDSYEALMPTPMYSGRIRQADVWLRDLVGQLDNSLVVIASREPLRWKFADSDWTDLIKTVRLDGLPMTHRLQLLEAGGFADPRVRSSIAVASAGLPFYLHLAVDAQERSDGIMRGPLVSQEEILGRFLQHVSPAEVHTLEVLAAARVFDYQIFRQLAEKFQLPGTRLAWNSLTSYSFVYPARNAHRLHQLIRSAIINQLAADAAAEVHSALAGIWEARALHETGSESAAAYREAAYHGLRAGSVEVPTLLEYCDLAVRQGGHSGAGGIAQDLEEWLAEDPGHGNGKISEGTLVLQCLLAEAAVRLGDSAEVERLTNGFSAVTAEAGHPAVARLAVAVGNGQRIAGRTQSALKIFMHIWQAAAGQPKLAAGEWASDLLMCQGRFHDAEEMAAELDSLAPEDEPEFRGNVARMRSLSYRFAFDYEAADLYLGYAESFYEASGSVLGQANVLTNRAELLAFTAPERAISEAARAIEVQAQVGAHHEIGKAYTALGVAHLRLGELDRAFASLQSAFASLDRAHYRSGRARAEFYLAAVHARAGRLDAAATSLRLAVTELEEADVYPTLIAAADRILSVLGITDETVSSAATRALGRIQIPDLSGDLAARITKFATDLLGVRMGLGPTDLYEEALAQTESASGYYNHNVRLVTPDGPVMVRMPIEGADRMDLAIWPETSVLRVIDGTVTCAPRLLHAVDQPRFMVTEFVEGSLLDELAPRGTAVPSHVTADVVSMFTQLYAIPAEDVPPPPADWPESGSTADFARRLSAVTADVYARFLPEFGDLFTTFGVPRNPLDTVTSRWNELQNREFRLLHTDVHRKNMIVAGGQTYFVDWELALWGDPVYDFAVHLHKMTYLPAEEAAITRAWQAAMPGSVSACWKEDLTIYLAHERVKSAIVDTVRYTKAIAASSETGRAENELAEKLSGKLRAAYSTGAPWPDREPPSAEEIVLLIRRWAANSLECMTTERYTEEVAIRR